MLQKYMIGDKVVFKGIGVIEEAKMTNRRINYGKWEETVQYLVRFPDKTFAFVNQELCKGVEGVEVDEVVDEEGRVGHV